MHASTRAAAEAARALHAARHEQPPESPEERAAWLAELGQLGTEFAAALAAAGVTWEAMSEHPPQALAAMHERSGHARIEWALTAPLLQLQSATH